MPSQGGPVVLVSSDPDTTAAVGDALGDLRLTAVAPDALVDAVFSPHPSLVVLACEPWGEALARLRAREDGRQVSVLVVSGSDEDGALEALYASGVQEVLRRPLRASELRARVSRLLGASRGELPEDARAMVELTQALASSQDLRELLLAVVRRIARVVRVERCSIVVARDAGDVGYVVASNDDAALRQLPIALDRYPEIQQVLQTQQPLTIADASTHPLLDEVRERGVAVRYPSLTLVPIVDEGRALGVLFLRAGGLRGSLGPRELSFCAVVANATAVALRNAREFQRLRDQSQQVTSQRLEAERKVQALERYMDLFLSSADGMVVIDPAGTVLYANPRAAEITGHAEHELRGRSVLAVVAPEDHERVERLREGFTRGDFPEKVAVRVAHARGGERWLSVATSSVLREDHAVLLTFRDVTEDHATAEELGRTKEFLASLIESSPDAIVAAGLDGVVRLFNSAAERIYGWSRDQVVGVRSVRDLYPPGVARELMQRIRQAPNRRLEGARIELLARDGARVPVLLSAALVKDRGVEVATVGIFSDLRERLKMEQRLAQAQQALQRTERQAGITELAGAAAHALNQPLTAIRGYAELLRRKAGEDQALVSALDVILRESERMTEIVRRIGTIQQYETRPYVGAQEILDLERTSPTEEPR
ncbi:MAG: PAS domain S-box protein [Deltaproteobacteria bacterium]|nr:PAS domain S-box protein [Deltaproteobacteria bacterium]